MERELDSALRGHRIFSAVDADEIGAVLASGSVLYLASGALLFEQDEPGDGFYVVLRGTLEVIVDDKVLAVIEAGGVVGEMGLVTRSPRSATVRASGEGSVWHLDGDRFEAMLHQGDRAATGILLGIGRDICRRFRETAAQAQELMPRVHDTEGGLEVLRRVEWNAS